MSAERIREFAPAKLNLALHVTGRREDGYHLLDMLVVFAEIGDGLSLAAAPADSFAVTGPFAPHLAETRPDGNLVIRARDALRAALLGQPAPPVAIALEKNLPVASGIGGGSADAAATLRGLCRLWRAEIQPAQLMALALTLGADVPMCLHSRPLLARGIGEEIAILSDFPVLPLLLVNPLQAVSTPAVFSHLIRRDNPAMESDVLAAGVSGLSRLRNDLQPAAISLLPVISEVLAEIEAEGARLARMSGSGASCFGLFETADAAAAAAERLTARRPGWFVAATRSLAAGGLGHPPQPLTEEFA